LDEYKSLQREAIDELRKLDIYFQYDDRLNTFWLRTNLVKLYPGSNFDRLLRVLDSLTLLRTEGKEPRHENGKYL
jgi:hypothetical protein